MKKASFKWLAMGLIMLFGYATIVEAQEQGQERQQRGQRGQRGQGRGQRGPGGGGFGGGRGGQQDIHQLKLALVQIEKVSDSLDVLPDQTDAIKKDVEKLRSARDTNRPRVNFQDLSEEERTKLFAEFRERAAKQSAAIGKILEEHLLPPQDDRLGEIALQVMGVGALRDAKVSKELKITEAQKKKLDEARDKSQAAMRAKMQELFAGFGRGGRGGRPARPKAGEPKAEPKAGERPARGAGGGFDREAMQKAFADLQKESEKNTLAVLTKEQKDQFAKMKGEPFELPEGALRRGFGGGFGGQRGRGGRGGGGRPGQGGGNRPARPSRPGGNDN